MKVKKYIYSKLKKGEKLHFSLFDPEKLTVDKAISLTKKVEIYGTDAIIIGGSTIKSTEEISKAIRENTSLPIILFPNSANALTKYADAVFFMSLLNSKKRKFLIGEQIKGAKLVKEYGLEPIGMGYIVINTGEITTVEKVAKIKRLSNEEVVSAALAAQYFGMQLVYLEAGSGANKSVPSFLIRKVKSAIDIPLVVGGGIKGPEVAIKKLDAGADIIVTGSVIERFYFKVVEIIDVIKKYKVKY